MPNETRPTVADFLAAYEAFAPHAVKNFNTQGSVAPQIFAVTFDDKRPGVITELAAVDPKLVNWLYSSNSAKSRMKHLIQQLLGVENGVQVKRGGGEGADAGGSSALLVVQITEIWLSDHPVVEKNKEAVMVAVHSRNKSLVGVCPILSEPTRHCEHRPLDVSAATASYGPMSMQPLPRADPDITKH